MKVFFLMTLLLSTLATASASAAADPAELARFNKVVYAANRLHMNGSYSVPAFDSITEFNQLRAFIKAELPAIRELALVQPYRNEMDRLPELYRLSSFTEAMKILRSIQVAVTDAYNEPVRKEFDEASRDEGTSKYIFCRPLGGGGSKLLIDLYGSGLRALHETGSYESTSSVHNYGGLFSPKFGIKTVHRSNGYKIEERLETLDGVTYFEQKHLAQAGERRVFSYNFATGVAKVQFLTYSLIQRRPIVLDEAEEFQCTPKPWHPSMNF